MSNYAIIENNTIVNIVVAEPEHASAQQWVSLPEGAGIGFVFDGTKWKNPNEPTLDDIAAYIRSQRNALLAASDWTQTFDSSTATKNKWSTYRQSLKDVPQQSGFPQTVVWPTQP